MSVNRYLPHVLVLPEDDANRQIANGFLLDEKLSETRIRILEEAGGWTSVLDRFSSIYAREMYRFPERRMILVIDLDNQAGRLAEAKARIPKDLHDRVFILGVLSEPEELRNEMGSYEKIGIAIARDCREKTNDIWQHRLLMHNMAEVGRLGDQIHPILYPSVG